MEINKNVQYYTNFISQNREISQNHPHHQFFGTSIETDEFQLSRESMAHLK